MKPSATYPRKLFVPPMWLTLTLSFAGIYGMNLVYRALTHGGWLTGTIGALLLATCVISVGTPLATAYVMKRHVKKGQHSNS